MSYKLKTTAKLINSNGTGTPEFISALKPSTDGFKIIPIPSGAVSSIVNVTVRSPDQGTIYVSPNGLLTSLPTLTRGAITIQLESFAGIVVVNPGDILKFSYSVDANPSLNPKVYFTAL